MNIELMETDERMGCTEIRLISDDGNLLAGETFLAANLHNDRCMLRDCVKQMLHRKGMLLGSELVEKALAFHSRVEWISDNICTIEDLLNRQENSKAGGPEKMYFEKVPEAGIPVGLYAQKNPDEMKR